MKILVVLHSLQAGGAERVTSHLVNHWAESGWDVTVLTIAGSAGDFYPIHPRVKRICLNMAGQSNNLFMAIKMNISRLWGVRKIIVQFRPDLVLAMMTTSSVMAVLAGLKLGVPVVVSERTYPPLMSLGRIWKILRRLTYPWAAQVVMLTSEGLSWLHSEVPRARGIVIPNPVSYPLPCGNHNIPIESIRIAGRKLLLAVGRLDVEKQFGLLLQAFAVISLKCSKWDLVILGEGPLRLELEAQIQRLDLFDRVHLPGRAGNISDWYERADLYVLSSSFEGFPNTLAEAMAHGCAVISYDCDTGPRDLIRHGIDGLLVKPVSDVYVLAQALGQLMEDDVLRQRFSRKSVEVRERFSLNTISMMWRQLFIRVVDEQIRS